MLIASTSCPLFSTLTNVAVSFSPASAVSAATIDADEEQHFTWGFSAHLHGVSGDAQASDCIEAFDVAFVESFNEANMNGDVHADACSVTSVTPATIVSSLRLGGGNYHYNGGGDYRYVCGDCSSFVVALFLLLDAIGSLTCFHSFSTIPFPVAAVALLVSLST